MRTDMAARANRLASSEPLAVANALPVRCGARRKPSVPGYLNVPMCPRSGTPVFTASHETQQRAVVCRFKPSDSPERSIDDITGQQRFTGDDESKKRGSVMLAVDTTAESQKAIGWVVHHILEEGDAVDVVHVVCDPRGFGSTTSIGVSGPSGKLQVVQGTEYQAIEPNSHIANLLGNVYDKVAGHAGKMLKDNDIPHQIHLPRIQSPRSACAIAEMLLSEAERLKSRALVIASHGPGALAEFGSVARYCYQHASLPLILIPSNYSWYASHPLALRSLAEETEETAALASKIDPARSAEKPLLPVVPRRRAGGRQVLLLVEYLTELATHWQWVAENVCRPGDHLHVWHLTHTGVPENNTAAGDGLASLPIALTQVLKARGLASVEFHPHAYEQANEIADKVIEASESPTPPNMVVVLNYVRRGMIWEAMHGSVASELARHCPVPLVLLQPGNDEVPRSSSA